MTNKLSFLIPVEGFQRTLKRFPLSSACSMLLCFMIIVLIHSGFDVDGEFYIRLLVTLGMGFFWFGAAKLFAEANKIADILHIVVSVALYLGLGVWIISGADWFSVAVLIAVIFLMISYAPYIGKGDNLSYWFFNKTIWFGTSISILAGLIWSGGISASLGSVQVLFGLPIPSQLYADLLTVALTVFAPLYALSWVPERFKFTEEDCHAPAQLGFMLNWVLAPLMIIYTLILYAYFIKVLGLAEFPKGHLTYMVLAYTVVGVSTYQMGWPLREEGALPLRVFFKALFPALAVPVLMMAAAIYIRIDQYGITVERYYVVLAVLYFLALSVVFSLRQLRKNEGSLPLITILLSGFLLVTAFGGPFSAVNMAANDQLDRLEKSLIANNILQDGKIVQVEKNTVSFEDRKSISSSIDYLYKIDRERMMQPWFEGQKDVESVRAGKLVEHMGLDFVGRYQRQSDRPERFSYRRPNQRNNFISVSGYDYLIYSRHLSIKNKRTYKQVLNDQDGSTGPKVTIETTDKVVQITLDGHTPLRFDLAQFERDVVNASDFDQGVGLYLDQENDDIAMHMEFLSMSGDREDDGVRLTNVSFNLFVKVKN